MQLQSNTQELRQFYLLLNYSATFLQYVWNIHITFLNIILYILFIYLFVY